MFKATALGLAYNEADGNWTDGESDLLKLVYELEHQTEGWSESASLTNLKSNQVLAEVNRIQ